MSLRGDVVLANFPTSEIFDLAAFVSVLALGLVVSILVLLIAQLGICRLHFLNTRLQRRFLDMECWLRVG
jgi:hypothetical protein